MKFSNRIFISFIFLLSYSNYAQFNVDKSSIEIGYGYNGAIGPYNEIYKSNFSSMNHFNVAFRFMFTEKIGAKLFYKTDKFVNDPKGPYGVNYNTFGTSVVYNVGKDLGLNFLTRDKFSALTHLDGGVCFAYLIGKNTYEKVGVIGVGITPMYAISNKLAITTDFTYNTTLKQHYGFDGVLLDPSYKPQSGSFYNFSIGLIFYLGENRYHSDWY